MRLVIHILILFVIILCGGFRQASLPVTITGHLRKNPLDTSAYTSGVVVFVKGDNKLLAKAQTDDKGDFVITFTPETEKSFDFYCTGIGIDTLLLSSVTRFESDTPEMTFFIPGQPGRNNSGQTICPKCKRADKVYKIQYGIAPVMTRRISESGDTTYSPLYKGTYQASCNAGPAKYYCDRDKVKF